MAAAAIAESFAGIWPDEEQVMSESGIIMGREELEELILNRIRKIKKKQQSSRLKCGVQGPKQSSWPR